MRASATACPRYTFSLSDFGGPPFFCEHVPRLKADVVLRRDCSLFRCFMRPYRFGHAFARQRRLKSLPLLLFLRWLCFHIPERAWTCAKAGKENPQLVPLSPMPPTLVSGSKGSHVASLTQKKRQHKPKVLVDSFSLPRRGGGKHGTGRNLIR